MLEKTLFRLLVNFYILCSWDCWLALILMNLLFQDIYFSNAVHLQILEKSGQAFAGHFNFSLNKSIWLCQSETLNKITNIKGSMYLIKFTPVSFVSLLFCRRVRYLYEKVSISVLKGNRTPLSHAQSRWNMHVTVLATRDCSLLKKSKWLMLWFSGIYSFLWWSRNCSRNGLYCRLIIL